MCDLVRMKVVGCAPHKGSGFKYFSEFIAKLDCRATLPTEQADQLADGDRRTHMELFA